MIHTNFLVQEFSFFEIKLLPIAEKEYLMELLTLLLILQIHIFIWLYILDHFTNK